MMREKQFHRKFFLGMILIFWSWFIFAQGPDTLWTRTFGEATDDKGEYVQQTYDGGYILTGWLNVSIPNVYLIRTDSLGDTLWTRTYGGSSFDAGYCVQQTADSGFIVLGRTSSFGSGGQVYLIKTDTNGDTIWTKTYGGPGTDYGDEVRQTSDGGYIIVGYTDSYGAGNNDIYLIKTDSLGDTVWTKTYGGIEHEYSGSVQQTVDGGYIVTGRTRSFGAGVDDYYLIKTDANGDTTWTRTYGGTNGDYAWSVQQTYDLGYIIAGWTISFGAGANDVYLVKTDSLGDTLWTKTYGGSGNDYGYSCEQTVDSGYIITGATNSFGAGLGDFYLVKTDKNGDTLWTKTYGGIEPEIANCVQQTSDGSFIMVGFTSSFGAGGQDVYLVKAGFNLEPIWTETYGGSGDDRGYSVQETSDNGYIITGNTTSFGMRGDSADVYLIHTNINGDTLWTQTYGSTGDDQGNSTQQTSDGGYIITGSTNSFGAGNYDVYLIKTDDQGDTTWTQTYGSVGDDEGFSVNQTSDGGYIITGYTNPSGNKDVYLIKTTADGDTSWTQTYGSVGDDEGFSVNQTSDGGYIITGYTSPSGSKDVYLIKTTADGDTSWTQTYGSVGDDEGFSVNQTSDGGYIITGYTHLSGDDDVYLIKTNANGDTSWTKTYGGTGDEQGRGVQQNLSGGYIICGYTNSFGAGAEDVYLIKTDENGELIWTQTYGGIEDDRSYAFQQVSGGGYIITGCTNSFGVGGADVYLIKTEPDDVTSIQEQRKSIRSSPLLYSIPNPFKDCTKITYALTQRSAICIDIYNLLGQKVRTLFNGLQDAGVHEILWDGRDETVQKLPCGIYFLKLSLNSAEGKKNTLFGKLLLIQ